MSDSELSDEIRQLISACVPDMDALELLVFLASKRAQDWESTGIEAAHRAIDPAAVRRHLIQFRDHGLVVLTDAGVVRFQPADETLESAVAALRIAHNERPVTLIRTVYSIADTQKIQSFADAFRLKKRTT